MSAQLGFNLQPPQPFCLSYFVPHSGVAEACAQLSVFLRELVEPDSSFKFAYVFGPSGCGKRHLCEGYRLAALEQGADPESVAVLNLEADQGALQETRVSEFVAAFEACKARDGLCLAYGPHAPEGVTDNPHVLSRLRSGALLTVSYPREEELRPLLLSLSERRNLQLSERSLDYLVRRIPLDPLSFDIIFDKISRISLSEGKPARFGLVRKALRLGDEQP